MTDIKVSGKSKLAIFIYNENKLAKKIS